MPRVNRSEILSHRQLIDEVAAWSERAAQIFAHRTQVASHATGASQALFAKSFVVSLREIAPVRVIPLRSEDELLLGTVQRGQALPHETDADRAFLYAVTTDVIRALTDARNIMRFSGIFASAATREKASEAARFLADFHGRNRMHASSTLDRLDDRLVPLLPAPLNTLAIPGTAANLVVGTHGEVRFSADPAMSRLGEALPAIEAATRVERTLRQSAHDAAAEVRRQSASRTIAEMPVEKLKDATRDRVRVSSLTAAGIVTVGQVLSNENYLANLPGVGAVSAQRIAGAARTLWQDTLAEMPVRIPVDTPSKDALRLVDEIHRWMMSRTAARGVPASIDDARTLAPLAQALPLHSHMAISASPAAHDEFQAGLRRVVDLGLSLRAGTAGSSASAWQDFLQRPADYYALIGELGFLTENAASVTGDLPDEIVEAVRALDLDESKLRANLRGYQRFAARFAIVQKKVLIGDEMGLGKTLEALAVAAHLSARGRSHALVICPAAVVTNWVRETETKTDLRAHRIHGTGRRSALEQWRKQGGVGVTTYETLKWLREHDAAPVNLTIVDEAHYAKNPDAQRSRFTAALIASSERAVLLTGTPLENRVDEFRNLVGYIRPDLVVTATDASPRKFRIQVAPAYLRRTQEDVLSELPELVEVDEWVSMTATDEQAYREAVRSRNFQAMRQAALLGGTESAKVTRLLQIVEEARQNKRKVIVFSNFLAVLQTVHQHLRGPVHGPLTGSVAADKRQTMVDEFSNGQDGAVLLARIVAGGTGLNIQAASVVVICEPQLKPTIEWQAIARAHRMGQLNSVQVHRLLSDEGTDVRITDILAQKKALFDDFADRSETAAYVPEAMDVSEADLVRGVIDAERERLFPEEPARTAP